MNKIQEDKRRATTIVIVGVVIIIAIIAIQARRSSSQGIIEEAFTSLAEADTYHAKAHLEMDLPVRRDGQKRPIVDLNVNVEGDVQRAQANTLLTGRLRTEAKGRGMVLFADGDVRMLEDAIAFRLDELPSLLNPSGNLLDKWTYVQTPLLHTNNANEVHTALGNLMNGLVLETEDDEQQGDELLHYSRDIGEEQKNILIDVFRRERSGNQGLHIAARLLRAFDVESFDVWIDKQQRQIRMIEVSFVEPVEGDGDTQNARTATLELAFTDYGKDVSIEAPQKELTVKPEVFAELFGQGDIVGGIGN